MLIFALFTIMTIEVLSVTHPLVILVIRIFDSSSVPLQYAGEEREMDFVELSSSLDQNDDDGPRADPRLCQLLKIGVIQTKNGDI